jgi:predicted anti-sigma-YlaC factor YlaD
MMHKDPNTIEGDFDIEPGTCSEGGIHRYLDSDLPVAEQPDLFEHLANCEACRDTMDSVMAFRRMSRQEYISLPPVADEQFFTRLAQLKSQNEKIDRSSDRAPLWSARRSVSVRAAVALAAAVFLFGLMLPMPDRTTKNAPLIQMSAETVDFGTSDSMIILTHIYTYIDGPTVEGDREPLTDGEGLLPD